AAGSVLAAILHGLLSVAGPRYGTTQVVAARHAFGIRGAYGGAFFTVFLAVGWFAVDCVIAAQAIGQLARQAGFPQGNALNGFALAVDVIVSILVAVYGHQTIAVFEKYSAFMFVDFCDVLRLSLLPKINLSLHLRLQGADHLIALISASAPLAVVVPFLLFIAVGEIWANYLDVYTAGLSALALNLRVRRWAAALAVGVLGGILAFFAMFVSNFKDQYTNFLLIT